MKQVSWSAGNIPRLLGLLEALSLDKIILLGEGDVAWALMGERIPGSLLSISRDGVRLYVPVLEYVRASENLGGGGVDVVAYYRYPLEDLDYMKTHRGGPQEILREELAASTRCGSDARAAASADLAGILLERCRDVSQEIFDLRSVKTEQEVEMIRRAAWITSRAVEAAIHRIRPGVSETEIAGMVEMEMRRLGATGLAFQTLVGSGRSSAHPHAAPSERRISSSDVVVIDAGASYRGYSSDMTRTVLGGEAPQEALKVLDTVVEAISRGLEKLYPGNRGEDVDRAVRSFIAARGFSKYFVHSTGHGVGVDVHEGPRLSPGSEDVLREGMVVTIEPGIYIPGKFGVRVEELVYISSKGPEILTASRARRFMSP